jgi:hypothetical protein
MVALTMISCKKVTAELSNYLANEVSPELRKEIEHHLAHCVRCSALLDSTRKVLRISGDDRVFELPVGYSRRVHDFLDRCVLP